jgi:hypothetical protein
VLLLAGQQPASRLAAFRAGCAQIKNSRRCQPGGRLPMAMSAARLSAASPAAKAATLSIGIADKVAGEQNLQACGSTPPSPLRAGRQCAGHINALAVTPDR